MAIGLLNCGECGAEFQPSRSQWDTRHRGRKYCGRTCMVIGNRKSSKVWWDANPLTNTVERPTKICAACGVEFTATPYQHQKLVKQPDANVYCTRHCVHEVTRHTEKRHNALKWMRDNPDVGGLRAARILGIPYITLRHWRIQEGMPFNCYGYKTTQTCGCCGEEYWPSNAQWDQREDYKAQVCSDKCHRELTSKRMKGVPNHKLRKHGLYSLEMQQVKQLRKSIYKFINQGANQ
jgi:hypothetical protein